MRLVDELLARPAYGERWARHWLDLVRFAETNGYERDATKPNAWRYRDYVIRAFNDDKPFDRFILEQLAGDELPDATAETLIATGFYRLGPWDDEPADPKRGPLRPARRHRQHHVAGVSRPDAGLRPLPQPQVRAADRARLLPHGRDLRPPRAAAEGRGRELDLPVGTPLRRCRAQVRRRIEPRMIGKAPRASGRDDDGRARAERVTSSDRRAYASSS